MYFVVTFWQAIGVRVTNDWNGRRECVLPVSCDVCIVLCLTVY